MNIKYPLNRYTIKFDSEKKLFLLVDKEGNVVGENTNGRELGRDAWGWGAQEVCYDYDLNLDEKLPLMSTYEKFKARSRMS
jgi:hypothetical protein